MIEVVDRSGLLRKCGTWLGSNIDKSVPTK